jgi:hypothetical protein
MLSMARGKKRAMFLHGTTAAMEGIDLLNESGP